VDAGARILVGTARAPLTCGELVQGSLAGRDFLISCPIPAYSRARVWLEPGDPGETAVVTLHRYPAGAIASVPAMYRLRSFAAPLHSPLTDPQPTGLGQKAVRALEVTLLTLGQWVRRAVIEITTPGPAGKGLGTSTADILATAQATAAALGRRLGPVELARIALTIEPSDSTMFPGLAMLDHRRGTLMKVLGPPPPLALVMLDLGGRVDTEQFNRRPDLDAANREKEPRVREALRLVYRGIREHDPALVARGATLSALAHQAVLPKPGLPELVEQVCARGGLGAVNTHSGTVLGVLAAPSARTIGRLAHFLTGWPGATLVGVTRVTGGGVATWNTGAGYGKLPATSGPTRTRFWTSAPT